MFVVPMGVLGLYIVIGVSRGMLGISWGMFGITRAMNIMGYDWCSQGSVKNIMEYVQCFLGYMLRILWGMVGTSRAMLSISRGMFSVLS